MEQNNVYFMQLLKAAIYDVVPVQPEFAPNWEYLYKKSIEQNVSGLVNYAVRKAGLNVNIDKKIMDSWNQQTIAGFLFSTKQFYEFKKMSELLKSKNICFLGLKGCVMRALYPVHEFRTMGDFDIYVKTKDLNEIKAIFSENGYDIKKDYVGIVCSKNNFVWEIFTSLEEEFKHNKEYIDTKFWEQTTVIDDVICPDETLFLSHLIVHTGKHCLSTGSGVRNLCDVALFINKYKNSIDFNIVKQICVVQGYYKIYCHIINAVEYWFGIDLENVALPQTDANNFTEYMLLNGVFGENNNVMLTQLTKAENIYDSTFSKILFPKIDSLKYRYKYLIKYPFLLPLAWIHRFFAAIFKRQYSLKTMFSDSKSAIKKYETIMQWIEVLDLLDH